MPADERALHASTSHEAPSEPPAAEPANEVAYAYVKERILSNELNGGDLTSEGEIARELALSRTPVREAFLRLEAEGWMRLFPKRGALIVPIAPGEAAEVTAARTLLESYGAAAIGQRDGREREQIVERLRDLIAEQRHALAQDDLTRYAKLDAEFHHTITDSADNSILTGFAVTLRERQQRMVAAITRSTQQASTFVADHERLVDLLAAADTSGFTNALTEHLQRAYRGGGMA